MAVAYFETDATTAGTNATGVTYKDITFTAGSGDLIVAFGINEWGDGNAATVSTTAGTTSSWTTILRGTSGSAVGFNSAYATVTTGGSLTVRVQVPTHIASARTLTGVFLLPSGTYTGTPTWVSADGTSSTGLAALTLAATSTVLYMGGDWDGANPGATATPTGGTVDNHTLVSGGYDVFVAHWTGQLAGTRNYGPAAPSGATWSLAGVAIREASGGSTNVALTGAVVGSTTGAPAGTVSATMGGTSVNLAGEVVASATSVLAGSLTLTTNIDDAGSPAGATTGAPAGTLTLVANVALGGQGAGSTTAAPAGSLSTSSSVNVALTGEAAGSVTGAPAGTVSAASTTNDVTLTAGAATGSVTAALAGVLTISSVGDVTLVGQPVSSTTDAPSGTLTLVSVVDVNLTGQPTGSTTAAPAGTITTGTNVTLTGLVAAAQSQALAGLLELVSSSSVNLAGETVASIASVLAGSLTITSVGDATPDPSARLTLDTPTGRLTLDPTPRLELT